MNPKLTDDAVGRLPVEAGRAELREEIVATGTPRATPTLSHRTRHWLVPLAAAAVVGAVAVSTVWYGRGDDGSPASRVADQPSVVTMTPSVTPSTRPSAAPTMVPSGSTAEPLPSSPSGYRAVLDAPGWTAVSTEAEDPYGEVDYTKGDASFEITWYGADSYDSYVEDREHIVSPPAPGDPVEVLGAAGQLWAYGADDHTVIREVRNGHWMELRGSGISLAEYRDLLGQLRLVDLDQFEASLPARFVTKDQRLTTALRMLSGITRVSGASGPDGQQVSVSSDEQDPYQLGAQVSGAYACAWLGDYVDATGSGDTAEAAKAVEVMRTSRQWPVLQQMNASGDFPEVIWDYADQIAAGQTPDGYREALGC